ncbi:endonuclease/exonuclease/phosphatase family protein [Marivita sp. XM-24bin2]|jgi:endonuclease/exonuclease/phosphatase family metal-dependent hydrolase|uniref:endonuclease/exonuclease/phosphatase family protein n=1 Tax=unclassified Marivita TaxID=2632480 RepID=UPI000D7AA7A3|nr:endonuclease/exonuclease/phosphatase family protein [Marivita sp. XM-24bin2]MCR9111437.1 endonuclease/exonuclease/phosphatase family protein [Paracoccaceae bacterium]PWL34021.1 MAG: metal-dependent hydrolase [Marivita sp. XM-24bin2]
MRIASYNIRKAVGLDWRRDPLRIIRVLDALDADVVALQEADKRLGARPAVLPEMQLYDHTGLRVLNVIDGPSSGWHGNALLVRDGWRVGETERLSLPGIEPRGALIADLEGPEGRLTLVGTHLGLRRGCRQLQLAHLLEELESRTDRAVIAGDFNEWSPRIGFDILDHVFDVISPGRSFHASRPVAPLDRFAVGRGLKIAASGVLTEGEARRASDHLPVWMDLDL